jgi:hypothetical protein
LFAQLARRRLGLFAPAALGAQLVLDATEGGLGLARLLQGGLAVGAGLRLRLPEAQRPDALERGRRPSGWS